MVEQIITFGKGDGLTGIITKPDDSQSNQKDSFLLLNAGMLHRIGFNRFNTEMARLLAQDGYASLRFDLHNIGDSANYDGTIPYDKQAIEDIGNAIDCLHLHTGTRKSILVGLCSGADYAHTVAVDDPRVSGVVFLDGYAYPTLEFYIRDIGPHFVNPLAITRSILKRMPFLSRRKSEGSSGSSENLVYVRDFPPRKKISDEMQRMIDRGVNLFYIYSGGVPIYYNYANQFRHMFRSLKFKGKVKHRYIKEADHTYTLIKMRQKLVQTIREWVKTVSN